MNPLDLSVASPLINDLLVCIGYGTVVGLLAKAIMPGKDPGGAVATLAMGVTGVIIGCGVLSLFTPGHRVTPVVTFSGLICGTAGAFVILLFYRMLSGRRFSDAPYPARRGEPRVGRPRRRRRLSEAYYYED